MLSPCDVYEKLDIQWPGRVEEDDYYLCESRFERPVIWWTNFVCAYFRRSASIFNRPDILATLLLAPPELQSSTDLSSSAIPRKSGLDATSHNNYGSNSCRLDANPRSSKIK